MQKNIKKGEKFNENNLTIKGPAGGLMPKFLNMIKGKKSRNNIEQDTPVTWDDI